MTEDDAKAWIGDRYGAACVDRLGRFVGLVVAENARQNLIAPSTIDSVWTRHVVDSAQLLGLAGDRQGCWLDIGSGGGFPGMIVALLSDFAVTLVEPRRRRAAFLVDCAEALCTSNAHVEQKTVERVSVVADVISARAVATPEQLLRDAGHCAGHSTRWILPRGHASDDEVDALRRQWKGLFHVEQSLTAPASRIFVLEGAMA